jgi:predicted ester cyclase
MSAANEALARSFFQAADRGRTPIELCSPAFTAYLPESPPMDLEGFDAFEAKIRSAFSDIEHPIEELVEVGDDVAVRLRFEGTHTGDLMGVPASGQQLSVEGVAFLRIVGGKVARFWGFLDQVGLVRQMKALPTAGPAGGATRSRSARSPARRERLTDAGT